MSCQNTECVARLHNSIRYVFTASSTHDQFEINEMRKEVLCDGQMDLSFCVNQISGEGGGNAVVAPLAYFPPFASPVHPPGNTGGITVHGQSSATLGRSLQDSKEMAALEGGVRRGESACTLTVRDEGMGAKMVQSFLASFCTLSIYSHPTALARPVCFPAADVSVGASS